MRQLKEHIAASHPFTSYIIKKQDETGSVRDGRKRKISAGEGRLLVRMSLPDRRKTAPALRPSLSTNFGINLSSATVKRRLCEAGINGRVARHKPLLTATHKKSRLDFAREHISWSSEMWSKVLWSDESRFCLYQNDGRVYVHRRIGEDYLNACVVPTVKHGGRGIMVWGCMMTKAVGHLALVSGNLNSCGYIDLLENAMIPSTHRLSVSNDYVFQQHNARCHTSRQTMLWFLENNVNVMAWPAQSPDMNPIENTRHISAPYLVILVPYVFIVVKKECLLGVSVT